MFTRYIVDKERIAVRSDCKIDCLYCKNSVLYMPQLNERNKYHKNYPLECQPTEQKQQEYIRKYFREHNIRTSVGFICKIVERDGFYRYVVQKKTNPKWCPKKIKEAQEQK